MMRDICDRHEAAEQSAGSARQAITELLHVGSAQRPVAIDRAIAVVPCDQGHRPIVAGLVVERGKVLGGGPGGHHRVATFVNVGIDMEAKAARRIGIELPWAFAAPGKLAFRKGQVNEVVGQAIVSQHPDHIGQVRMTPIESILQMIGLIEDVRHITTDGAIELNGKRGNRSRQRQHKWRPEGRGYRLRTRFGRRLERKSGALALQAGRR